MTQEALLRAWRELPRLRDPDRFAPWARRILVNCCRDIARWERRNVRALSLDDTSNGHEITVTSPDHSGDVALRYDLHLALSRLTIEQRTVVALHYTCDLPLREVAETLGIPGGTAKSRLNAALVALRRTYMEEQRG